MAGEPTERRKGNEPKPYSIFKQVEIDLSADPRTIAKTLREAFGEDGSIDLLGRVAGTVERTQKMALEKAAEEQQLDGDFKIIADTQIGERSVRVETKTRAVVS